MNRNDLTCRGNVFHSKGNTKNYYDRYISKVESRNTIKPNPEILEKVNSIKMYEI